MSHETTHIKVYPTKATAVGMAHPGAHKLALEGTLWPRDSFTARRLTDGSVTNDKDRALAPVLPPSSPAAKAESD